MASNGSGPGKEQKADTAAAAIQHSCDVVEKALGKSHAFRVIERGFYVVKQGSSVVMINVLASGANRDRALVRVAAQVVAGVRPEPRLLRQLLILNGTLRFGAFAYVPEGDLVFYAHSLLGGTTLDASEVVATVRDVALVADAYDDRIVAAFGGRRMQDVIEDSALSHILNPEPDTQDLLLHDDEGEAAKKSPAAKKPASKPAAKAAASAKKPAAKAAAPAKKKAPFVKPGLAKAAPAPAKKPAAKKPGAKVSPKRR